MNHQANYSNEYYSYGLDMKSDQNGSNVEAKSEEGWQTVANRFLGRSKYVLARTYRIMKNMTNLCHKSN